MTWSPFLSADVAIPPIEFGVGVPAPGRLLARRHAALVVCLAASLDSGDWPPMGEAAGRYLSPEERGELLAAILGRLDIDEAADQVEALHALVAAGEPLPPLTSVRAEAREWTSIASLAERKHYLVAIFRSLPAAERVRALPALQRFALT